MTLVSAAQFVYDHWKHLKSLLIMYLHHFHAQRRRLDRSPNGKQAFGFGARIGFWPCLHAPYLQVTFLFWHFDFWFGYPSYKATQDKQRQLEEMVRDAICAGRDGASDNAASVIIARARRQFTAA